MATPFALLTIQIAYLTSPMPKTYFTRYNFSISCTGAKSLQFFAYFGLKFVAMATLFPPLKNQIAYLNSPTAITLLFTQKKSRCLVQNCNQCKFGLFLPKFGCHGNSLSSLENSDRKFEFADPKNWILHPKIVSISCTELKSVEIWLIFGQIWLPWQLPFLP